MSEEGIIEKLGITPGPWKWKITEEFDAMVDINGDEIINDGSAHGEYSQCIKGDSPNAFLIATAPELLDALIDMIEMTNPIIKDELGVKKWVNAINVIEKAINKPWDSLNE